MFTREHFDALERVADKFMHDLIDAGVPGIEAQQIRDAAIRKGGSLLPPISGVLNITTAQTKVA